MKSMPQSQKGTVLIPIIIGSVIVLLIGIIAAAAPQTQKSLQKGYEEGQKAAKVQSGQESNVSSSPTTTPNPTQTPTATTPQEINQEQKKEITYEVVEQWSVSNDGEGKAILISPDYLNEVDMMALGEILKSDTKKYRRVFIFVYTDRRAAEMRKKTFSDELKGKDLEFYDKHYVGQYTKNGNTGLHEYTIYFDGFSGTNDKTIKY